MADLLLAMRSEAASPAALHLIDMSQAADCSLVSAGSGRYVWRVGKLHAACLVDTDHLRLVIAGIACMALSASELL